jgi:hypothetical protein
MMDSLRCRYAVIKYAHDPLRQEMINVGVVIWRVDDPQDARWRFDSDLRRVERLYPTVNPRAVRAALSALKLMAEADPGIFVTGVGGPGSIVLTEPRAARCADMDVESADLYDTLVAPAEGDAEEPREKHRSSRFIKGRMNDVFKKLGALKTLATDDSAKHLRLVECRSGVKHTFDYAYRNGAIHRIDALSFDHGTAADRIGRARSFANLVEDCLKGPGADGSAVIQAVIQVPTEALGVEGYTEAKKILHTVPLRQTEVCTDADLEKFCIETTEQLHI